MNKLVAILALGLIVGGFLLVTFSYAAPTENNGTPYLPELPNNNNNNNLPPPPNDSVPPDAKTDTPTPPPEDNTPYHEELEPTPSPTTPPPVGETYVTKYILQNYVLNTTYNAAKSRYEGRKDVVVAYPVAHHHETHVVITLSNGMSMSLYRNGGMSEQYGPTTGYHDYLWSSSTADTVTVGFFIYGTNAIGSATISLYVTEWPSSKLSIFGTETLDMTIGVVMLIAGFAALLLFGKR